jgi:hypothetical protein
MWLTQILMSCVEGNVRIDSKKKENWSRKRSEGEAQGKDMEQLAWTKSSSQHAF